MYQQLLTTAAIEPHVAHLQRLPYCIVVLGTAVARKNTQPTLSTFQTLGLNDLPLQLTHGISPPASELWS